MRFIFSKYLFCALLLLSVSCALKGQETFSFVQMCDPQLGMGGYEHDVRSFEQAVLQINKLDCDFVIICGDLVHHASDSTFADFLRIKDGLNKPCYLVPGNHDVGNIPNDSTLAFYRTSMGADYYDFQHKGASFIVSNSLLWKSDLGKESKQHDRWFKKTLRKQARKDNPQFVIGHFPLYLEQPNEEEAYFNFPPELRSEMLTLFREHKVEAYLSGHTHRLVINQHSGIQLVSGESTSKNFDDRPMGFRLWEVSQDSVMHHFVALEPMASSNAQVRQTSGDQLIDPSLNLSENQYMDRQAEAILNQAARVFSEYPPLWPEPEARQSALLLLDVTLHEVYAPYRLPVQKFLKERIRHAVGEMEGTEVAEGAYIWKLYNHGFVIRTQSVTIGFDLVSGKSTGVEGFNIEDDVMERLIDQCDVLFISHYHGDHAEEWVAQAFIDKGKPVVAPPEVWKNISIHKEITHLERIPHTIQTLPLKGGEQEINVVVYPGHQGSDIENNVTLVITPEGLSFTQMGDQSNEEDFHWIDDIGAQYDVDVLLPNCWTTDIVRVAKGIAPALMITGHENEMGHTIDHREPYWLTYQRRKGSDRFGGSKEVGYDTPLVLMTWGESYHYQKNNF